MYSRAGMARTTKRPPKIQLSATRVLDLLMERHFNGGAYACLREVRNATGWEANRSADALIVSLWPSRGVWFGGIEVKVDRHDWLRELSSPEKSAPIQKYCNYWWVATTPGIVQAGELPETWGHLEVGGEKPVRVAREAPRLPAEPLDASFIAAVLRNVTAAQSRVSGRARDEGYAEAKKEFSTEALTNAKAEALQAASDLGGAKFRIEQLEEELAALKLLVTEFEQDTGLPLRHAYWQRDRTKRLIRVANALGGVDLDQLEKQMRLAVEGIATARQIASGEKA